MDILLVCDHFPPAFGPRMGYLCKYLKRVGCEVDVISEYLDDKRFAFLCGYSRTETVVRFYRPESGRIGQWERGSVLLRDMLFHYKDRRFVSVCKKLHTGKKYDLVVCSTFRTFPLRAAARLSEFFGVPLVVDLRDIIEQYPDTSYLNYRLPFGNTINRWIERRYTAHLLKERNRVLQRADAVVSVSPWHTEYLRRYNPNTHLIYNGYDPELFYPSEVADSCFRITFTGRMISLQNRNPEWLFEAVANMLRSHRISEKDFRLSWYVDPDTRDYLERTAGEYGIEALMDCHDFVPASEIPAVLNRSSILLQLANRADENGPKGIMTTKFFEALAVGKPLLLVRSDESYLAELIARFDCGLAAESVEEIVVFLQTQYQKWKETGSTRIEVDPELVRQFSRQEQAGSFLGIFEEVCGRADKNKQL